MLKANETNPLSTSGGSVQKVKLICFKMNNDKPAYVLEMKCNKL